MADELSNLIPDAFRDGRVIIGLFAVLAVVAGVGTVFALGGAPEDLIWAIGGGLGIAVVVIGAYEIGRRRGIPHSHATAAASIVFGVLLLGAVVTELLYTADIVSPIEIGLGLGGAVVVTVVILAVIAGLDRQTAA